MFAESTTSQRSVLLDNTSCCVLCREHIPPYHTGEGPRPSTRVTVNLRRFVHTFVLVRLEVHLLSSPGHVELEVVLHHKGGVVVVSIERRRHHCRVMCELIRDVLFHEVIVWQEDHLLLLVPVDTK